ncbi:hypothetical protein Tco_1275048 [Tanacetum coccineum]
MDSDKYLEGQCMQRPPLFESDHFIYWKNIFETYVNAKDLDLWHIILNGDFPPVAKNEVTQMLEVVPFEEQSDDLKMKLAKNDEAKMVLYNALPKKENEIIFMCDLAKDIWQSLLITHQESIVRKFLKGLHPKECKGHGEIEEINDLSSLVSRRAHRVGIKRLHDDLEVTAAKLMLLVYKLLLLVLKMDQDSTHMVAASKVPMLKPDCNAPPITKVVEGVETIIAPTTAEEKAQMRLEAVEKRFGGNAATKKTQRNLLNQQYENFTTSCLEVLDQTFDRLQKLICQLEIHGESISQEDVN